MYVCVHALSEAIIASQILAFSVHGCVRARVFVCVCVCVCVRVRKRVLYSVYV